MIVLNKYKKLMNNDEQISDMTYLSNHIWQLKHVFYNEIIEIKDSSQKTIAFTNAYSQIFNRDYNTLDVQHQISQNHMLNEKINNYEQNAIKNKLSVNFICQIKINGVNTSYFVRIRVLINPTTKNCCGIFILYNELDILGHTKLILKLIKSNQGTNQVIFTEELTEQQQQIIYCALLGFKQRKEIALLLEQMNNKEFSERQVKHYLESLYKKFDCSSLNELIAMVVADYNNQLNFTSIGIPEEVDSI